MSDETTAQPAVARSAETASTAGAGATTTAAAPESVAPVADTKASKSSNASGTAADDAGADGKIGPEEQGKASLYNAVATMNLVFAPFTLPIELPRAPTLGQRSPSPTHPCTGP